MQRKLLKKTDLFELIHLLKQVYTREDSNLYFFFEWVSMTNFNVKKKNRAIPLYNLTEQDNFLFLFEADNRPQQF